LESLTSWLENKALETKTNNKKGKKKIQHSKALKITFFVLNSNQPATLVSRPGAS